MPRSISSSVSAAVMSSDIIVVICALAGKRTELLFDMKKTLLLIDGSSYLYRAYHALPDLRNAQGHPTGAMHGVISMLRRIRQDYHVDYLACIFDRSEEHTSELQSRGHLVCRLLLDKIKNKNIQDN